MPKYSHIIVQCGKPKGNHHAILVRVKRAMRRGGISETIIEAFREQAATATTYDQLYQIINNWVTVEEAR